MALELRKQAELMENPVIGNLVGQAAFAAEIAISNEASETPKHTARLQLANAVVKIGRAHV